MVTFVPLQPGRINLTSGTYTNVTIVHCQLAGEIKLIWANGATSEDYAMVAGDKVLTYEASAVTINSGTFVLAKA